IGAISSGRWHRTQDRYRIGATSFVNVTCAGAVGATSAPTVEAIATATAKAGRPKAADLKNRGFVTTNLIGNLPMCRSRRNHLHAGNIQGQLDPQASGSNCQWLIC